MRIHSLLLATIVMPLALGVASPASAGFNLLKTVKDVGKTAGKAVGGAGKAVGSVAKDANKTAGKVGWEVVETAPKVVNATGEVVSKYYDRAGDAIGKVPGFEGYKPLAKYASRCAKSAEGKVGGVAAAGAALLTGGAALVQTAGSAALTGCYGKTGYDAGKAAVRDVRNRVNRDIDDVRRSYR
jgi:hypothetical protein